MAAAAVGICEEVMWAFAAGMSVNGYPAVPDDLSFIQCEFACRVTAKKKNYNALADYVTTHEGLVS